MAFFFVTKHRLTAFQHRKALFFIFMSGLSIKEFHEVGDHYLYICKVKELDALYANSDYVTLHVPYTASTKDMVNAVAIAKMKDGVSIINLARDELVNDEDLIAALGSGKVAYHVTDFPSNRMLSAPHVVALPHLGASTPESEDNCAVMAADELRDFLENGNIKNSVNFPNVIMERSGVQRLCIIHRNVPAILANITTQLGAEGVNVENMTNKSKGEYAYTIVDTGSPIDEKIIKHIRALSGIIRMWVI